MSGTDGKWEEWRQVSLLDATEQLYVAKNSLEWWVGKVSPPFQESVDTSGSKSAIAAVIRLLISRGHVSKSHRGAFFYFLYKFSCFKHC